MEIMAFWINIFILPQHTRSYDADDGDRDDDYINNDSGEKSEQNHHNNR